MFFFQNVARDRCHYLDRIIFVGQVFLFLSWAYVHNSMGKAGKVRPCTGAVICLISYFPFLVGIRDSRIPSFPFLSVEL